MGRKLKYGEATKILRIRIPESKYEEFRKMALEYLENFIPKIELKQRILTEYINTRKLDDFLEVLKEKRIDMVIDIRDNTYNKSKQGFNPKNLKQFLAENGIEYKYIHKLGNPSKFRKEIKDLLKLKEKYIEYIKNLEELQELVNLVNNNKKIYCLICYCNTLNESECHRFWLREYILNYSTKRGD